ncbi:hypothetical protein H0H81_004091 [Sphagnurus paluster]|uniref:Uncharacterized protein n=1 Tax=Sphagnurus paluster TaxID=117069 RepID=A0A9P7K2H9_9AGAR|nr:hypothetical protein H0H81_004091 [Sphagnurus paluster]
MRPGMSRYMPLLIRAGYAGCQGERRPDLEQAPLDDVRVRRERERTIASLRTAAQTTTTALFMEQRVSEGGAGFRGRVREAKVVQSGRPLSSTGLHSTPSADITASTPVSARHRSTSTFANTGTRTATFTARMCAYEGRRQVQILVEVVDCEERFSGWRLDAWALTHSMRSHSSIRKSTASQSA